MIADHTLDSGPVEHASAFDRLSREHSEQHRLQDRAEPMVRRDIEAFLLPREHGRRDLVTHQLAKNELQLRASYFEIVRKASGIFDDTVVEKRRAHFQRMGHAHAIRLVEDVVGKVVLLIDKKEVAFAQPGRAAKELWRQQTVALVVGERAVPEQMRPPRR